MKNNEFWKVILSEQHLEEALQESYHTTVVIFKHSTRCSISRSVLDKFQNQILETPKKVSYYFLDLLKHRDLSNKIAQDLKVLHQSPQMIVLQGGIAVKSASHRDIDISCVEY